MQELEQLRRLTEAPELLAAARPGDLRRAEELRRSWPADLVAAATTQAELRVAARGKFGDLAERMLFTRAGLEQASSATVARHRAERFAHAGGPVVDACCGLGGDLLALGAGGGRVLGVDRDARHALLARHNAAAAGISAAVVVADVTTQPWRGAAAVFVDPARRDDRGRGGSSPPLAWCFALGADRVAVKAAPGLDLGVVPAGWEAEFVAEGRDLKEATLWSPGWATASRRATVLPAGDTLVAAPDTPAPPVADVGPFVLDPSPAVTRAGAVADLAALVGGWLIDPRIAFVCTATPVRTPFARTLRVEASQPFAVKPLAATLRALDVGAVDLRRRGLAGDVDELRRRLRPSGRRRAVVLLTRHHDRPWTVVCTEPG